MARQKNIVKINLPGGILSSGNLRTIVKACETALIKEIRLGSRQQLFIEVTDTKLDEFLQILLTHQISFETDQDDYPNILSSYVAHELFNIQNWLTEGVYVDILDSFDYKSKLKINIVDSTQTMVPFFTGNINFISSQIPNYWFLYIRFPKTAVNYQWKGLVYSEDISAISKEISEAILTDKQLFYDTNNANGELLQQKVEGKRDFFYQAINEELLLPAFNLPYYEGINKYDQKLWLGIYRRDELFPVEFLKDICAICFKTKVAQIYTTPWKSLIIKGIAIEEQKYWSYILGKHNINVRHAFNELNWQLEDLSAEGLNIKRHLVRRFDSIDLKTHGLCFAVKTQPRSGLFGSVIIKKLPNFKKGATKTSDRFDILYTKDFNPNSKEYIQYRSKVSLADLETHLISLSKFYFEQKGFNELLGNDFREDQKTDQDVIVDKTIYQCKLCFTIYDDIYGDEFNGIKAGTEFKNLPTSYCCPVCDSSLNAYIPVNEAVLYQK